MSMTPALTRLRYAISSHRGLRALSWVLAFTLTCLALPQLQVHVHSGAADSHVHTLDQQVQPEQALEDAGAAESMHLHDSPLVTFALLARLAPLLAVPCAVWNAALDSLPDAATHRAPPHRPPIV
jgi:hypothetical protein